MTSAHRTHDATKHCPRIRRWVEFGCSLSATEHGFSLHSLQIWSVQSRIALPEESCLARIIAWRRRLLIFPDTTNTEVILEVLPRSRKMLQNRDSESLQRGLAADTGLHQHLRRMDRTQGQYHLKPRANAMRLAIVEKLHAGGLLSVQGQPSDQRVSEYRQVRPVHVRKGIRPEYRLAFSIADQQVDDRGAAVAFHQAAVLIFKRRDPDRVCSFHHSRSDRVGIRRGLNENRSSRSAVLW